MRKLAFLIPVLTFGVAACGGGGEKTVIQKPATNRTAGANAPSVVRDIAAIKQVLVSYGATPGGNVCAYYSRSLIAGLGGRQRCQRVNAKVQAVIFRVENVAVNGDTANVVVSSPQSSHKSPYRLVRESSSSDANRGWKISKRPVDLPRGRAVSSPKPTPAQDRAQIVRMLNAFGATGGVRICDFYAPSLIKRRGGLKACQRAFARLPAPNFKLGDYFSFRSRDRALAIVDNGSRRLLLEVSRVGGANDAYGGWAITGLTTP